MSNVKYALMNKNRVVLDFLYDIETHHIVKIPALYDNRYTPPAVIGIKGNITTIEEQKERHVSCSFFFSNLQ